MEGKRFMYLWDILISHTSSFEMFTTFFTSPEFPLMVSTGSNGNTQWMYPHKSHEREKWFSIPRKRIFHFGAYATREKSLSIDREIVNKRGAGSSREKDFFRPLFFLRRISLEVVWTVSMLLALNKSKILIEIHSKSLSEREPWKTRFSSEFSRNLIYILCSNEMKS